MALVKEIEQQKKEYLNDFIDNDKKARLHQIFRKLS
jgi:hypothetical protein